MANSKIACSSGRATIIDPNHFGGMGSSSNIPVNNEDLNISVVLTTFKKGRTILTANNGTNSFKTQGDISINFIDGSNINGKQVLTSNYTDLTTIFDDNTTSNAGEGLGITSIDIDFNSQQAPLITINFIDIKGTAIFQNEGNISAGKNKYSTFFQLPYPLFKLQIKGYYGLPVEYCLHMYKFNSKFNSQTGNFEITANFIGFTYAMLSDMLIGYLKAIPYTEKGKARYEVVNNVRRESGLEPILTLDNLMVAIARINESVKQLSANDVDAVEISNAENKEFTLNNIKDILTRFCSKMDIRGNTTEIYKYVIKPDTYEVDVDKIVADYKEEMDKALIEFNENSNIQLDTTLFNMENNGKNYLGSTSINRVEELNPGDVDVKNLIDYKHDPNNYLNDKITDDTYFESWWLSNVIEAIDNATTQLENAKKAARLNLGRKAREVINLKLGFDPTIRNIIEIFTTAVEVFMESIYQVSSDAYEDVSTLRNKQLKTKFLANENHDIAKFDLKDEKILPWPGYRERKDENNKEVYIEKYLGATKPSKVLEKPTDVDEIRFINDLLMGFIESAAATDLASDITNEAENMWFPINPADTKLFKINTFPYKRIGKNGLSGHLEVANLLLIRGTTFLANNRYLIDDEIKQMAEIDAMSMVNSINDVDLKLALSNLTYSDFLTLTGKINNVETSILIKNGINYDYDYILKNTVEQVLPISDGFSGTWDKNTDGVWEFSGPEEVVFLTNYVSNPKLNESFDGGIYVKIFTIDDYNTYTSLDSSGKPANVNITNKKMLLSALKLPVKTITDAKTANFNTFGGSWGVQEFIDMDWDDSTLDSLPLRYLFFEKESESGIVVHNVKTSISDSSFNRDPNNVNYYTERLLSFDIIDESGSRYSDKGKNYLNIKNLDLNKMTYPFVTQKYYIPDNTAIFSFGNEASSRNISVFGSRWFYGQSNSKFPLYAKALLFLNSLPWNGEPLESTEILNLFNIRAGFIHVPKVWAAYIGGLIWRNDSEEPIYSNGIIVGGGSGGVRDPIVWKNGNEILQQYRSNLDNSDYIQPKTTQSIFKIYGKPVDDSKVYKSLDLILGLPNQIKEEFKKIFFKFVDKNSVNIGKLPPSTYDFNDLNEVSQIISDGTLAGFDAASKPIYKAIEDDGSSGLYGKIKKSLVTVNLSNTDKYQAIMPIYNDWYSPDDVLHFELEYKDGAEIPGSPANIILSMLQEEVVIANTNPETWVLSTELHKPFYNSVNRFETYFKKTAEIIKAKCSTNAIAEDIKQKEIEIFGTSDNEAIKFQLYKTCKNINDKWLGSVDNIDNISYQCGGVKNTVDTALRDKYRPGDTRYRLIDSFRFVDRAFSNIGDLFYMDPVPVNDYLMNSPNTSIFDAVSQLLASNNFTFIPLPTFINYNEPETLKSMFETYPNYEEAIQNGICGPSFVSVYAGDSSKHLDFGENEYPSDGFDFQCDSNGNMSTKIPPDFVASTNNYENDIAIFSVNYGQQNQNIFKDITLDQSEFAETDESLRITDNISHKGSENNISIGGQNIFNVYAVRSYKAEVEMMGNAMIQPMMHFQLNNIPMFHGAYLITRVKHSIKPNFMSTVFSGSRVRYPKTELLSGADFYMGIIDSMNLSAAGSNTTGTVGSSLINGYTADLRANLPNNKVIEGSTIPNKIALTQRGEKEILNWQDGKLNEKNGVAFLDEYAKATPANGVSGLEYASGQPWSAVFVSYIMLAGDETGFPKSSMHFSYITDAMNGKNGYEAFALGSGLKIKPEVGDLICEARPAGGVTGGHCNVLYKTTATSAIFAGGNLGSSAKNVDIKLDGGYITDLTNVDKATIYIKKTDNKYYNKKKLIGTGNFDDGINNGNQIGPRLIYEELKKQLGYSDAAIAGIMGNMYQESELIPTATNPNGAYGLVQWKDDRKTKLLTWLSNNGLDKTSYKDQIQYLKYEIDTTYKYTNAAMKKETDVSQAAKIWVVTFELTNLGEIGWDSNSVNFKKASKDGSVPKRVKYATEFSKMINSKNWYLPR
jgi:hypothetical protein